METRAQPAQAHGRHFPVSIAPRTGQQIALGIKAGAEAGDKFRPQGRVVPGGSGKICFKINLVEHHSGIMPDCS